MESESTSFGTARWVSFIPKNYVKFIPIKKGTVASNVIFNQFNKGHELKSPEYTELELEGIADAIEYLLGAELTAENGFTEDVIEALHTAYAKTQEYLFGKGGTENDNDTPTSPEAT